MSHRSLFIAFWPGSATCARKSRARELAVLISPCSSRRGASPEQGRVRWCAIRAVTRSVSDFPFRVGKQVFWIFRSFRHVDHHQYEPGRLVRRRGSKHRRTKKIGCAAALSQSLRPRSNGNDAQGNGADTDLQLYGPVWLLTQGETRKTKRVRLFTEFLSRRLEAYAPLLAGQLISPD